MTPKQYLMQLQILKTRYKRSLEDVEQIRSMMESAGAIRYDKVNIQSSPKNDKMADYIARLDKAESKAIRLASSYLEKYEQIRDQINMISPQNYSDILYLRYVQDLKLWKIADELNYEYGTIRILHGKALVEFGKCFPESLRG